MLKNKLFYISGAIACIVFLSGCEKIELLQDYFSTQKKTAGSSQQTAALGGQKAITPAANNVSASGPILARVGSWTISQGEFKERLKALKEMVPEYDNNDVEQNKQILQELVRQQLLVQDAIKKGIDQKPEVQQAVNEFRNTILVREVAIEITNNIIVSDEEAKQFYEQNKDQFVGEGQWRVREIVVASEEEGKKILIDLYNGADFAQIAQEKSISSSAEKGGDLGLLSTFDFPKMRDMVNALEPGETSSVFKGPQGFYIIKLEEKLGAEEQPFEPLKEDIKAGLLLMKQQQTILGYLNELRNKIDVQVNEKFLEE